MKREGYFITLEGTDGVGKSTHAKRLVTWLRSRGKKVILTCEPGGSPLAEKIRSLLLNPSHSIESRTELLLYEAARVEHVERVVRPALRKGFVVLCDRFTDATFAYQGFGRGLDRKMIVTLNRIATQNLEPDLTLWFDYSPRHALIRVRSRKKGGDRLEQAGLAFQARVRAGYAVAARLAPHRIQRVPVQEDKMRTQNLVRAIVERKLFR